MSYFGDTPQDPCDAAREKRIERDLTFDDYGYNQRVRMVAENEVYRQRLLGLYGTRADQPTKPPLPDHNLSRRSLLLANLRQRHPSDEMVETACRIIELQQKTIGDLRECLTPSGPLSVAQAQEWFDSGVKSIRPTDLHATTP